MLLTPSTSESGHIDIVKLLLEDERVDVNRGAEKGATALHYASENGHVEVVKLLLDAGVDVNKANDSNILEGSTSCATSLFIAAKNGHTKVVKLLLADERIEAKVIKESRFKSLYTASNKGDVELVKLLLNVEGFDFNEAKNGSGTPSLQKGTTSLAVASWMGHHEIVKLLFQSKNYKVDVNKAKSWDGRTPLYTVSEKGHTETVKALLAFDGIEVNKPTKNGVSTPQKAAERENHPEIVALLKAKIAGGKGKGGKKKREVSLSPEPVSNNKRSKTSSKTSSSSK